MILFFAQCGCCCQIYDFIQKVSVLRVNSTFDITYNYIPLIYVDLITYPCPKLDVGSTISFSSRGPKHIVGLVQNCSNSIANALGLLQYRTESSILDFKYHPLESDRLVTSSPCLLIISFRFGNIPPSFKENIDIPVNKWDTITVVEHEKPASAHQGLNKMTATLQTTFSTTFDTPSPESMLIQIYATMNQ